MKRQFPFSYNDISQQLDVGFTWYVLYCLILMIVLGVLLCIFKTFATKDGEHDIKDDTISPSNENWSTIFRHHMGGFSGDIKFKKMNDHWLGSFIGLLELFAYRFLIQTGQINIIGAWLGFKVLGGWKVWQISRTSSNRFIFFSALIFFLSYVWWLIAFK